MRSNGILSKAVVLAASAVVRVSCSPTHEDRGILENTFDYVIVGGGTAGLVMAERLSEDPDVTVAVIEAGSYPELTNPVVGQAPASAALFAGSSPLDTNPLVDWNFVTEPQAGGNGRQLHYARGKCFGGSSARNLMLYQRGTVQSYEKWAEMVGDDSYTWENMLPYFKKSVAFSPSQQGRAANATVDFEATKDFDSSNGGGPLSVVYPEYAQGFSSWVQGALEENGISPLPGLASGDLLGAQYTYATITPEMVRDSSATSFLSAARGRDNLKVIELAKADKILFDTDSTSGLPKATGVRFRIAGLLPSVAHAKKEVILSAGTFQSPQLLMLSGIGPREHLSQFDDIPLIADRPGVGQNMQDHIFFGPSYRVDIQTVTRLVVDPVFLTTTLAEYVTSRSGLLTSPVADFIGFEKVPRSLLPSNSVKDDLSSNFPQDWPEIEYLSAAGFLGDLSSLLLVQPKDGSMYGTIAAALVAPLSRGNVTLSSSSGADLPKINPNWLTHPADQAVAVAAYKRVREFWRSDFMRPLVAMNEGEEYFPGLEEVKTDEEILDSIRENFMTVWHASCTCRMGKRDDEMAVVDKDAKVIGVEGVRVVDASSMALLPPGHPMSTIYAFAEKIADQIRKGE